MRIVDAFSSEPLTPVTRIKPPTPLAWRVRVVPILALLALGCGGKSTSLPTDLVRLIQEDPAEIFRHETLFDTEVVRSWDFTDSTTLGAWALNHEDSDFTLDSTGLKLHPERRHSTLDLTTTFDADTLDAFEIRLRGLPRHSMTLQWRREGEDFNKRREVTVPAGRDAGQGYREFRLSVSRHPAWSGKITGIRFEFLVPKDGEVVIERVDALLETIAQERLVEALSRPWKVELGNDLRNSLLAPAGVQIERAIDVPRHGQLWISYGLQEGAPLPTLFEIHARSEGHGELLLFEDRLETTGVWRDAVVDLSLFENQRIDLRLSTSAETMEPGTAFPVWANPEMVDQNAPWTNLLFISIDTLRADHLSLYGYARPTTPNIDQWASDRGWVFENAVAASPWTLPSHISMFTGLNAHRHGINHPSSRLGHLRPLAAILQESGYATLAITGGGFVHPQYGFSQGFDRYQTQGVGMAGEGELEHGLASALAALERYRDRPFFLFFHTYEVHNPFRAREPYLQELTGRSTQEYVDVVLENREARNGFLDFRTLRSQRVGDPYALAIDLYDSQIAYTDQAVGELFATLDRLELTDQTLVLLTSDHGELFGEHGLANHVSLYEDNLRVPLILAAPQRPLQARRIEEQVRSVDIMPTLLELMDLPLPQDLDGVSLVPLIETGRQEARDTVAISYAAASNHGLAVRQANRAKYHFRNHAWVSEEPVEMFFDLIADRDETQPLAPDSEAQRLRTTLLRRFAAESPGLRIRFANIDGAEPLVGMLQGPDLQIGRPKAIDIESAILRRDKGSKAHFEVLPGRKAEILVEGASRPLRIVLDHQSGSGEALTLEVDPGTLDAIQAIRKTPAGFEKAMVSEASGDGVFIWWQGERLVPPQDLRDIDPELQQQLQALGYIDN